MPSATDRFFYSYFKREGIIPNNTDASEMVEICSLFTEIIIVLSKNEKLNAIIKDSVLSVSKQKNTITIHSVNEYSSIKIDSSEDEIIVNLRFFLSFNINGQKVGLIELFGREARQISNHTDNNIVGNELGKQILSKTEEALSIFYQRDALILTKRYKNQLINSKDKCILIMKDISNTNRTKAFVYSSKIVNLNEVWKIENNDSISDSFIVAIDEVKNSISAGYFSRKNIAYYEISEEFNTNMYDEKYIKVGNICYFDRVGDVSMECVLCCAENTLPF